MAGAGKLKSVKAVGAVYDCAYRLRLQILYKNVFDGRAGNASQPDVESLELDRKPRVIDA